MTREEQMVVIERDELGNPSIWCDPEIVDLITALNTGGLQTVASCSGHGERLGVISLKDGRQLIICHSLDEMLETYQHNGEDMGTYRSAKGHLQPNGTLKVPAYLTKDMLDFVNKHARANDLKFGESLRNVLSAGIAALKTKQKRVPRHLSPDCRLGKFMANEFKKLCPDDDYHFMELMGDGSVAFHIKDEDRTVFGMDIMTFAKIA